MAKNKPNWTILLVIGVIALLVLQYVNVGSTQGQAAFTFTPLCIIGQPNCPPGPSTTNSVPSATSISPSSQGITINVWQDWQLFDIHGNQYGTVSSVRSPFQFMTPLQFIPTNNAGFIRIAEHHVLTATVPGFDSGVGFYLYSGVINGQLLVNGQPYAQLQQSPFPAPGYLGYGAIQAYLPNAVNAGAAFSTGDSGGTSHDSVFYLIFNKALQPSACNQYPSSCIDMTILINQGKDATLSATFQETWTQWAIDLNPVKSWFGPCDYTVSINVYSYCIKNTSQLGPTPVNMPAVQLSSLGILTTTNGSPTFMPTITVTTYGTNTIGFTTTTIVSNSQTQTVTQWSVQYSNTTTVGTVTNPPPNLPSLTPLVCASLPSWASWICGFTFGIANWIIVTVVVVIFALYLLLRRGNSGTGSAGV